MMRSSSTTGNNNNSSSNTSISATISCHDCGNKAKRDCSHSRCRTCCKSRGFPCSTHVKSTWVPVARRRQRQHQQHQHQQFQLLPSSTTLDYHHLNLPLSLSRPTTFHHRTSPPGRERGEFPAEINSLATFKCIRVRSEDNVVEQYAYQTSINIEGHLFKGILYDQGSSAAGGTNGGGDQSSSAGTSDHHHHQFSVAAATSATAQSGGGGANLLYPSPLYSAPLNAFLPGMQFFPHPRP